MFVRLENVWVGSLHVVLSHDRFRSNMFCISIENESIEFVRKSHFHIFQYLQRVILSVAPFANVRTTRKYISGFFTCRTIPSSSQIQKLLHIPRERSNRFLEKISFWRVPSLRKSRKIKVLRWKIRKIRFREKKKVILNFNWNMNHSRYDQFRTVVSAKTKM